VRVTLHSQIHEWRERQEDGRVRIVKAAWDARQWNFFETYKDLPDWTELPNPSIADYEALRDVLFRKHQRNRVPLRFLEYVDALLATMRSKAGEE
jgi:hypothetical protein